MRLKLQAILSINSVSLTIGTALVSVALFVFGVPLLEMIELKTYDPRFRSRSARQPASVVALALIDEKSLDTEGRWPWPRSGDRLRSSRIVSFRMTRILLVWTS